MPSGSSRDRSSTEQSAQQPRDDFSVLELPRGGPEMICSERGSHERLLGRLLDLGIVLQRSVCSHERLQELSHSVVALEATSCLARQDIVEVELVRPPHDAGWLPEARELLKYSPGGEHGSPVNLKGNGVGRPLDGCCATGEGAAAGVWGGDGG